MESMVLKMRKMKDSGIEWIGEIPEGWEVAPIRSCFNEVRTKNTDGQEQNALQFKSGNIISKTNFNASTDDYVADTITNYTVVLPDTVMINGLNLNYDFKSLRVALVKEKGVITSAYLAIFPDRKKISPQYATYLFKGYETKMAFHNMGAGIRKTLGYKEFKNQPLLLPSKEEQNKISAYLDSKCSHIDTMLFRTHSSIEEYKKLKQAVITQAVTKGVRGEREMKDSGVEWIGEIPVNWTIQRFARVAEVKSNLVSPDNYLEYPQISPENIEKDSGKLLLPCRTVAEVGVISGNHLFYKGQILYSKIRPKLNKVCIAPFDGLCSADMYPIESKNDTRNIMYCILSNGFLQQVSMITENRVKMPKINQVELSKVLVAIPETIAEQKEIADYLDTKCAEIDGLIVKKEQLVKELESYKKSLIYEVVTGKREV